MKALAALVIVVTGIALAAGSAWLGHRYLSRSGGGLLGIVAGAVIAAAALLIARAIARSERRRVGAWALALVVALAAATGGSVAWGRITYARFGLTVYGVLPIPLLDLTVDARGALGFRDKTHLVTVDELAPLAGDDGVEVVVGIGWDSQVLLDPQCARRFAGRLHALPTPEAIVRYRSLKAEGKRVALLLHSTC